MSTITRAEAQAQLEEWTKTDSLLRHARAVEVTMRAAAEKYGPAGARSGHSTRSHQFFGTGKYETRLESPF